MRPTRTSARAGGKLFLQFENGDRARLGAGVETYAAPCAAVALIFTEVVTSLVQTFTQPHATDGTGLDTQPAALAFLLVYLHPAAVYLLFAFVWHFVRHLRLDQQAFATMLPALMTTASLIASGNSCARERRLHTRCPRAEV